MITVNSFACTEWSLGRIGKAGLQQELLEAAARLARAAATEAASSGSGRQVLVAGAAPWRCRAPHPACHASVCRVAAALSASHPPAPMAPRAPHTPAAPPAFRRLPAAAEGELPGAGERAAGL